MKNLVRTGLHAAVVLAALALAGCTSSGSPSRGGATATGSAPAGSVTTQAPAGSVTSQAPAAAAVTTGPVGTTFAGTDSDGNKYTVTLDQVLLHAAPDNSFDAADSGKYLVGLKFTIKGVSGSASDDVNNDGTIIGSDSQVYSFVSNGLAAGTNFNSGTWNVSPGTQEIGWETVELPDSVKVAKVEWSASGGFGGAPDTWLLP